MPPSKTKRLRAAASFVLVLLPAIAIISLSDWNMASGPQQSGAGAGPFESNTLMEAEMYRLWVQAEALKNQMLDRADPADPALRREQIRSHLRDLRRITDTLHQMNLNMIEDVDRGRIASGRGLKQRLELNAELAKMQLAMLDAEIRLGDEPKVSGRTDYQGRTFETQDPYQ